MPSSRHFFAVNLSTTVFSGKSNFAAAPGRGTTARNTLTFAEKRTITPA